MDVALSLMARLRQATGPSHEAIEALLLLEDPALGLDRYGHILMGFELFLSDWEPRVTAALPARLHPWFTQRSRRPFLLDDLRSLGLAVPRTTVPPDPGLVLDSLASAFGSMYVMEGSALGGQVIAGRLSKQLGLGPGDGAAYFNGWGRRTGALWKEFRERLACEVGSPWTETAADAACTAAVRTFDHLSDIFRTVLGPSAASSARPT